MDLDAIVYYRYERILEDIGAIGASVVGDDDQPETSRASEALIAESFFAPGGIVETVAVVGPRIATNASARDRPTPPTPRA